MHFLLQVWLGGIIIAMADCFLLTPFVRFFQKRPLITRRDIQVLFFCCLCLGLPSYPFTLAWLYVPFRYIADRRSGHWPQIKAARAELLRLYNLPGVFKNGTPVRDEFLRVSRLLRQLRREKTRAKAVDELAASRVVIDQRERDAAADSDVLAAREQSYTDQG